MNDFQLPAARDLPRGQLERRARHLVRELRAARRRRRLLLTLAPAVVILLTAATGFTVYVLRKTEPTHLESIGCYDRASLDANLSIISPDGRGAVAQCRELWAEGTVGGAMPPRLVACVLQTGPIGVFPSSDDETCERMGLADLTTQGAGASRRFVRMRNEIYAQIGAPPSGSSRGSSLCVGEGPARALVRRALDKQGYAEWEVTTGGEGFSAERPCAAISFDSSTRTALLWARSRR